MSSQTPLGLLVEEFRHWRSQSDKKRRIPEALWDRVIDLIDQGQYSKSIILSRLSIGYDQLRAKLAHRKKAALNKASVSEPLSKPTPSFINAVVFDDFHTQTQTSNTHFDAVITKPNGTSLMLKQLAHAHVLMLVKQFTE